MEFDDAGRLVVGDDLLDERAPRVGGRDADNNDDDDNDDNEDIKVGGGGKRQRISKFETAKTEAAEARSKRGAQNKKGKKSDGQPRALGAAYKSNRAGGDVKKKGQAYEPYAYVPLDGKSYTKRNRGRAVEQMSTVVKNKGGGGGGKGGGETQKEVKESEVTLG